MLELFWNFMRPGFDELEKPNTKSRRSLILRDLRFNEVQPGIKPGIMALVMRY
jgi:hypothetical protein